MTMKTNVALAIAAASLFASTAFAGTAQNNSAKVNCYGANACKGKSDCHTQHHACKGMNDCKGKGMNKLTAQECSEKGGATQEKK